MTARIDAGDMEGIFESIETQRAGERDDVAAINKAAAKATLSLLVLVKVNPCVILVEPPRKLMLGLFDGHTIEVIDLLANLIIPPSPRAAGKRVAVCVSVERQERGSERLRIHHLVQLAHTLLWSGRIRIAISHHDPAHKFEHRRPILVPACGADIDDAALLIRVLA